MFKHVMLHDEVDRLAWNLFLRVNDALCWLLAPPFVATFARTFCRVFLSVDSCYSNRFLCSIYSFFFSTHKLLYAIPTFLYFFAALRSEISSLNSSATVSFLLLFDKFQTHFWTFGIFVVL